MQTPAPFDYERATSVEGAIAALGRLGPEARIIAGGHSLLPMMKLRLATPAHLVDINDLDELAYIREEGDELAIGALTRHVDLLESGLLAARFPAFADAERVIADPVVRNRGTIGGSLCQADAAEDLSAVCSALKGKAVIRGPGGERVVGLDRGSQSENGRGIVGRRVGMGQRAADRAAVAHLCVSDPGGEAGEPRNRLPHHRRRGDLVVGGECADHQGIAAADLAEGGDAGERHHIRGLRQIELQHGQQALSAREELGLAVILEQRDRVGDRLGTMEFEALHAAPPPAARIARQTFSGVAGMSM